MMCAESAESRRGISERDSHLIQLGLFGERVVAKVDRLCCRLRRVATPCLAPKPLLWQRVYRHHVLRVVGQVLIEIGERVGIFGERVVEDAILVAVSASSELVQVHNKQSRDVVRPTLQVIMPIPLGEKAEARRVGIRIPPAKGRHGNSCFAGHLHIP
eukprot:scaffold161402_cov30-Tisochrysis_lutea.AAC.2